MIIMKQIYSLLFILVLVLITNINANAQQVVSSAGNMLQNSSGSLSFTIGELVIDTRSSSGKTLTQGFHQPKITITAINELADLKLTIAAYPNPTSDWVKLTIEKSTTKNMEYALYDLNGKLLVSKMMNSGEVEILLTPYLPSTYFLKVKLDGKEVKTFKIIKQ
jgi:hypothetical protein